MNLQDNMNRKSSIIMYTTEDGLAKIETTFDGDTVWLSIDQMAELFQRDKSTISRHIKNIFAEGELVRNAVVANFATTAVDGKTYQVDFYNLDVIISVGYRVKSKRGTQFRIWATNILKEYLRKGFAMDDERLKGYGGGNYWKELLGRIRDIRSSEKVLSLAGELPALKDIGVAKNYLQADELKVLNNLVSGYFDLAEISAIEHKPMYMEDYVKQLDLVLTAGSRKVLTGAGTISHDQALSKAKAEYRKYQENTLSPVEKAYLESLKEIKKMSDMRK